METQRRFADIYRPHLLLQLYAEVGAAEAHLLAQALLSQLQICAPVVSRGFSPYWKIPAYHGFVFEFAPHSIHDATFECLVALCPMGWSFRDNLPERSAVWNPKDGAILLTEQVRWAHLELYYAEEKTPPSD